MKDNREVNNGIRTLVTDTSRKARILGTDDADEIAAMYSQDELKRMVDAGVLSGDWESSMKASKSVNNSPFPEDYPGFDVLGAVEGMTPEKLATMSDEDILKIDGIGKITLEKIRAYKK